MKKYLLLVVVILSAIIFSLLRQNTAIRRDNDRLLHNNTVLYAGVDTYRTQLGQSVAQVGQLELTVKELHKYNSDLEERIRQLDLKLRRVESASVNAVSTQFSFTVPLEKGIVLPATGQTVRPFIWQDPWNRIDGAVSADSVECSISRRDTLDQVIYRVPHRFLFIRYGTKEIRQVVSVRDPKSTIVYSEYIILKREK